MTRTTPILIAALALVTAACAPDSEQDTRIAELEATIASGRLVAAESTIQALQATPTTAPLQAMATPTTPTTQPLQATPTAASDLQQVRLVRALDGDSGIAADANGEFEFRLYGVDAPERDEASRVALEQMVAAFGNDLYAEERDMDRYGRRVVVFSTRDGSRSVNVEMVRQGYASAYLDYGELDGVVAAEAEAQASGRGIWALPATPTPTPVYGTDAYWIDQDKHGNFRKTFEDYLYTNPAYASANPEWKEYVESRYEPLYAQFRLGQDFGALTGMTGPESTAPHFFGYLSTNPQIGREEWWAPRLRAIYDALQSEQRLMSQPVYEKLRNSGIDVMRQGLIGVLHPFARDAAVSGLDNRYRRWRTNNPQRSQGDFFMEAYPQYEHLFAGGRSRAAG